MHGGSPHIAGAIRVEAISGLSESSDGSSTDMMRTGHTYKVPEQVRRAEAQSPHSTEFSRVKS